MAEPALSPDGRAVAFVRDDEVWVAPVDGGAARQLTAGARAAGRTHGLAEFIAQEEMERRSGFWWSPDSQCIAFCGVDNSCVPLFRIPHVASADPSAGEEHHYPFAGCANARVTLGVVPAAGGDTVWCDVACGGAGGNPEEEYLARVAWAPDSQRLLVQLQSRDQGALALVALDAGTGRRAGGPLLEQKGQPWVNLHECFRPLSTPAAPGAFLWASEASGFRHLQLHAGDGALMGPLTAGPWAVDSVEGVDEAAGLVYFMSAGPDSPLERHLWATSLWPAPGGAPPAPPRRLTQPGGWHTVCLDHGLTRFVDSAESPHAPPRLTLRCLRSGLELGLVFTQPPPPKAARLGLTPPRFFTLPPTPERPHALHGALYEPSKAAFGAGPYPTVVSVYGGPHVQTVSQAWGSTVTDMRAQMLRSAGFLVLKLDNRGSSRRGLAFEAAIWRRMGELELRDQAEGVAWAVAQGIADASRVAIYGWSYGGYLSALAVARMPAVFRAGVAGAGHAPCAPGRRWSASSLNHE